MRFSCVLMAALALVILVAGCSKEQQESIGNVPSVTKMRAEQVEAQLLLNQIFKMQQAYYAANRRYTSNLDDIGVTIPSSARYRYAVTSSGSSWSCDATANLDSDATIDQWIVDQSGRVICATDDAIS